MPEEPALSLHNSGSIRKKRFQRVAEGAYEIFVGTGLLYQFVEGSVPEIFAVATDIVRQFGANLTLYLAVEPNLKEIIRTEGWRQI